GDAESRPVVLRGAGKRLLGGEGVTGFIGTVDVDEGDGVRGCGNVVGRDLAHPGDGAKNDAEFAGELLEFVGCEVDAGEIREVRDLGGVESGGFRHHSSLFERGGALGDEGGELSGVENADAQL